MTHDSPRVRDTRKGEWPKEGQDVLIWVVFRCEWIHRCWSKGLGLVLDCFWFPAPPNPEVDDD